jgi:phosphoglycerate transport regulatory protein PgtC
MMRRPLPRRFADVGRLPGARRAAARLGAGPMLALALVAATVCASVARAETVTVITSFPKELTAAYKKAFEARHPGDTLEILNKNTAAGIAYVREQAEGNRPDVFWASAPDAFEVLAQRGLLVKSGLGDPQVPARIGNYPVNDPEGYYLGQALAGYGIMWNTRYLRANKLPEPKEWADLTRPVYFGHVATSSPSRSGTTHLTVETILQGEGWDAGWEQLLRIAGNCAAITERSFGVPDGVSNGQYGIGLVIDFFGLAAKNSGMPTEFVYPSVTSIVPASIALVAGAKAPEGGKRFIRFALSEEGQQLLLRKEISRLPVLPAIYAKAPADYPNPFDGKIQAKVNFDSELSESRYYVVLSLFDQVITFRHKELVAATRAILDAEKRLGGKSNAQLDEARKLVFGAPIDEKTAADKQLLALFRATRQDAEATRRKTEIEEQWASKARTSYARAIELAGAAR